MKFVPCLTGQTVQKRPIPTYKTPEASSDYIYLIAGVHGDEPEGVYVLSKLFDWLKTENIPDLPMIVIPEVNRDGLAINERVNANKVDLNRNLYTTDWTSEHKAPRYFPGPHPLSEPENKFLHDLFEQYKPAFVISFHTWKPMLNFNGCAENVAQFLTPFNGYPVHADMGYPTPGSLGTFIWEKYGKGVLTFECPELKTKNSMDEIWLENEKGLKALFQNHLLNEKLQKN